MNDDSHRTHIRELRRTAASKYKPEKIRLLLVAEAPPAADDRYFYFEDVTSHDWLFLGVADVLLGRKPSRSDKGNALTELKDAGVFLIDLRLDPVDGTDLQKYVPDLVSRCRILSADRIVLIKATVFDAAYEALLAAGLPIVNQRVYFPSTGRQAEFRRQLSEAVSGMVLD